MVEKSILLELKTVSNYINEIINTFNRAQSIRNIKLKIHTKRVTFFSPILALSHPNLKILIDRPIHFIQNK